MNQINIPELHEFLATSRAKPGAPDRLIVSGNWRNPAAARGIFQTLGARYPEIQRISGGQLQTIAPAAPGAPGERFAGSCWRTPCPQAAGAPAGRHILCSVVGVFFRDRISPPRLRELQLKLKVICPTQPHLVVRHFEIGLPDLMAMEPSIPRWVASRLYSTGSTLYERINGTSSHWGASAAG